MCTAHSRHDLGYETPRRTSLGSSVNRGNGAALSWNCPGIYERRGKDSNLRGLSPIAHPPARPPPKTSKTFGDGPQLRLDLAPLRPLAPTVFQGAPRLVAVLLVVLAVSWMLARASQGVPHLEVVPPLGRHLRCLEYRAVPHPPPLEAQPLGLLPAPE